VSRREIVRPPRRLRRVLHATDFSSASRAAFRMAVGLAVRERASLMLLHVLTPPSPFAPPRGAAASSYLALLQAAQRQARLGLAAALTRARAAGARVRVRLVEGDPADEILKLGQSWRADLIVIGTHGRGAVSRFFMGSVAEHVVRRASRPVLTVRGR